MNELRAAGVTHVLTAAAGVRASFPEHFKYLSLDVMDVGEESLENYFVEADEFLRDAPLALVHCMYGMSRSATLVLAHLMCTHGYSLDDGLWQLKHARRIVKPNQGFLDKLRKYETMLDASEDPKSERNAICASICAAY